MAVPNSRIIRAPGPEIMEMLRRRMAPEIRKQTEGQRFDAIALIHANLPNIYFYADIAQKASAVLAAELTGSCPQHITTLALLGDVSAVQAAMDAIELAE